MDVRGYTIVLINWNAPCGATRVINIMLCASIVPLDALMVGSQACGRRRCSINAVKAQPCCKKRRHSDILVGVNTSLHVLLF